MGKRVTIKHNKNGTKTRTTTYSHKNVFGTRKTHTYVDKNYKGCYIATCVYGSYDCPEVWTLRRYRDNKLAKSVAGKVFIHCYYKVSPTLVKLFGSTKWFKRLFERKLNNMVAKLNSLGFENTPYNDKEW